MALTWVFQPFTILENTNHESLFVNQQNAIANFEPFKCIELLFVLWQVVYKYCEKSFINKPTFFNIVPQLIKKTYHVDTTWFYRFACSVVAQAHNSLRTRLLKSLWWTLKSQKTNILAEGLRTWSMLDDIQSKTMHRDEESDH